MLMLYLEIVIATIIIFIIYKFISKYFGEPSVRVYTTIRHQQ